MDYSVLERSSLFSGVSAADLRAALEEVPHHIQCYDKGEIIFHFMETAELIGVILEGEVDALKPFANGNQMNVSVRITGTMIGPAAAFSKDQTYPCDIVAASPATIVMLRKTDLLKLMQKDIRILANFTTEIATAAHMLQQRLELMSYNGIAQKAAFWLLSQAHKTGKNQVHIPGSVSKWAMQMNVSRPSLHRELTKLAGEGLIRYDPPVIELLDETGLMRVLEK